jgi:uncharacterized radical SAM protein YgiQ
MTNRLDRFLPMTRREMDARGWRELDVLLITGDAYFDHPSHGAAVIGRVLEASGYRVGIIACPKWRTVDAFKRLGRPRLFAGVTAGAVDSIVNNYTAHMAKRRDDLYAPGGRGGGRPDMATLVYANRVREAFPKLPVILGGIEASLRRFAYFDVLKQRVRRSLLVDSRADLLVFGPGERQVVEAAHRLASGQGLAGIPGTARLIQGRDAAVETSGIRLPDFSEIETDTRRLLDQMLALEIGASPAASVRFFQVYREGIVIAEPQMTETPKEMEQGFSLPYVREIHPSHAEPVPAFETVRWSIISHRGCPGGCSFCGLAVHQGRGIVSRTDEAILEEARQISRMAEFRGTITDVGGPTANAFGLVRTSPNACESCRRFSCLHPRICSHLDIDAGRLLGLLDQIRMLPGIKHLFLASGIRHDLALRTPELIAEMAQHYTGGHLKAAPEHVDPLVLKLMRKPPIAVFEAFEERFLRASRQCQKEQYIVPYFIAGFVGCGPRESRTLEKWLSNRGQRLRQSQTFIPLAGTTAAAMFAAKQDSHGVPLYVPDQKERRRQKAAISRNKKQKSR